MRVTLFIAACCVTASASAQSDNLTLTGYARSLDTGELLYVESHAIADAGGARETRVVLYHCSPDSPPFARKLLEYRSARTAPTFEFDDARSGFAEGMTRDSRGLTVFARAGAVGLARARHRGESALRRAHSSGDRELSRAQGRRNDHRRRHRERHPAFTGRAAWMVPARHRRELSKARSPALAVPRPDQHSPCERRAHRSADRFSRFSAQQCRGESRGASIASVGRELRSRPAPIRNQLHPAVEGSFCSSSSSRFTFFCGQFTSATPANMIAMPVSWLAPRCSSRNHQPRTAAIAGFT